MSKELFVLVPDGEDEDHSVVRYRFPLSSENIAVASHSSDADVTYIIRETVSPLPLRKKKEVSPWRQRFGESVQGAFTSAAIEMRNKQIRWKQVWDSIGMVLLVLQLCAHVLTQINGAERGDAKAYSSSNTCTSSTTDRSQNNGTVDPNSTCISPTVDTSGSVALRTALNIHFIVDVYFIVDLFVRYRVSYVLHRTNGNRQQTTNTTSTTSEAETTTFWRTSTFYWFLVDFLLIFPHGFCWKLFEARKW